MKLNDDMPPPEYGILGDSAFVLDTRVNDGKIVRSWQSKEMHGVMESTAFVARSWLRLKLFFRVFHQARGSLPNGAYEPFKIPLDVYVYR